MISLICFILAAICNAVMDTCSHHFNRSVFNDTRFKAQWWNGEISWRNKYNGGNPAWGRKKIPVHFTDAFHFFKSLMIVFIVLSIVTFNIEGMTFSGGVLITAFYGLVWNIFFNMFYNKLLLKYDKVY